MPMSSGDHRISPHSGKVDCSVMNEQGRHQEIGAASTGEVAWRLVSMLSLNHLGSPSALRHADEVDHCGLGKEFAPSVARSRGRAFGTRPRARRWSWLPTLPTTRAIARSARSAPFDRA